MAFSTHKKIIIVGLLILFNISLVEGLPDNIIYVSTDGSGDYTCDGVDDQVQINAAISAASPGDTVQLNDSTYIFNNTIYVTSGIIFQGESRDGTILKLKDGSTRKGWQHIVVLGGSGTILQNFTLDGNKANQVGVDQNDYVQGIRLSSCTNCRIYNVTSINQMTDNFQVQSGSGNIVSYCSAYNSSHDAFYGGGTTNVTFSHNYAWNVGAHGVRLYNTKESLVEYNILRPGDYGIDVNTEGGNTYGDNIFRYNYIDCTMFANFACMVVEPEGSTILRDQLITNNVFATANSYGFYAWERDTAQLLNITFTNNVVNDCSYGMYILDGHINASNNIITNCDHYGIYGVVTSTYNDVWNNGDGDYGGGASNGIGDISEDPLFADIANDDFHLKSGIGRWDGSNWIYDSVVSPCIDAGNPSSIFSNEEIPNGGRINMGAYGNTNEASKSGIIETENHAPILNSIGDKSVDIGSPLEFTISATDLDSDPLTYSATNLPTGAIFSPATQTFSWTPSEIQTGTYQVHFEVTDVSLTDSEDITITVTEESCTPTQTMNISYTSTPVIDGLKDDWAGMSGISFEDDSGRGSADNTVSVKALWNDDYLYVAFEVADSNLQAVEAARDGALYLDDVVEMYIDTLNNDGSLMQTDDYHFLVNLNNAVGDQKGTGSGNDASWDCGIVSAVTMDGTLGDASDIDTGYFVEIAIPWSDIGVTPLEGSVIGLDFAIGDRDNIADGYQFFDWNNLITFAYPDGWGDAVLINNTAPILDSIGDSIVSLSPSSSLVVPGETFTVDVMISPGEPIIGAQFNLDFDSSLLTVNSVAEGNLFSQEGASTYFSSGTIDNIDGTVTNVYGSILGESSVSSEGVLATITLTAGGTGGISALDISNAIISDINSNSASCNVNDATVRINSPPSITSLEPAQDAVFDETDVITIDVIASDADKQSLSYTLKIDGVTRSTGSGYSWTTDYNSEGIHTIDVIVSDGISETTAQRTITVNNVHPRWDVNEDGTVDVLDLTTIGQQYGTSIEEPYPRWDVNQDGVVNILDMTVTSSHFGETGVE